MSVVRTVLIAVSDAVLADSLRFSLELEGYDARVCEEPFLIPAGNRDGLLCLVLDQKALSGMMDGEKAGLFTRLGIPAVLIAPNGKPATLASARHAGIADIVEQPLFGGMLFEAIQNALARRHPAPTT